MAYLLPVRSSNQVLTCQQVLALSLARSYVRKRRHGVHMPHCRHGVLLRPRQLQHARVHVIRHRDRPWHVVRQNLPQAHVRGPGCSSSSCSCLCRRACTCVARVAPRGAQARNALSSQSSKRLARALSGSLAS